MPDADLVIKLADILDVNVSQLLGAKLESRESEEEIARQLARIAEQLSQLNGWRKRLLRAAGAVVLLSVVFAACYLIKIKTTSYYGYIGSGGLYEDAQIVEWIETCDKSGGQYFILFSACSPAEISEGYVGKLLLYVPDGFSDMEFHFEPSSAFFAKGKEMRIQIGVPYTKASTYQFGIIETPENNISAIVMQDVGGTELPCVITKTREYAVFDGKSSR